MLGPASIRNWRDHVMGRDTDHQLILLFQPGHLELITIRPVVFGIVSSVPMIFTLPAFALPTGLPLIICPMTALHR